MIIIELHAPDFDVDSRKVVSAVQAILAVDETGVRVLKGSPAWASIQNELVVNHPETKEDLTFADDWELWARTLPEVFRSDMTITIKETIRTDGTQDAFADVEELAAPVGLVS